MDRADETPAMMIANDIMSVRKTATWQDIHDIAVAAVGRAVAAEREACAKIAEDHFVRRDAQGFSEHGTQCLDSRCNVSIARAIRARS